MTRTATKPVQFGMIPVGAAFRYLQSVELGINHECVKIDSIRCRSKRDGSIRNVFFGTSCVPSDPE